MLFNIFEFGRKTYTLLEERPGIDTYSSLFGKKMAVVLVLSQAMLAFIFTLKINAFHIPFIHYANVFLLLALFIFGLVYIFSENSIYARRYRAMSSVYIILFYLILIIGLIL